MKNIRFPLNINVLYVQQNNPNPLLNISYVHIVLWQIVQTCYNQCPSLCDPSRAHLTITYPNECLVLCLVHNLFLFDVLVWAELSCCNSLMNRKVVCLSSACHMNMHMSISREQPPLMPIDTTAVASASSNGTRILLGSCSKVYYDDETVGCPTETDMRCFHSRRGHTHGLHAGTEIYYIIRTKDYFQFVKHKLYAGRDCILYICMPDVSDTDTWINCYGSSGSGWGRRAGIVMSYNVTDVNEMHWIFFVRN